MDRVNARGRTASRRRDEELWRIRSPMDRNRGGENEFLDVTPSIDETRSFPFSALYTLLVFASRKFADATTI